MAELHFAWLVTLMALIFLSVALSVIAPAQSQSPVASPTAVLPAMPTISPDAGSVVKGFVMDGDGNPVPGAAVTLWKDGKLWQHGKVIYNRADNPQMSNVYGEGPNLQEYELTGLFWYGLVEPGQYIITAEKDGCNGSTNVSVGDEQVNDSPDGLYVPRVMVNITLDGYRVPALAQEQLSYTGGIAGTVKTYWGYGALGVNVSLWQNGQMVRMPKNPQASSPRDLSGHKIDFLFEHLAPGQYQVVAEYHSPDTYYENVTANVSDQIENVGIVLSRALNRLAPDNLVSSPGIATVLLSIGIAVMLVSIMRRAR